MQYIVQVKYENRWRAIGFNEVIGTMHIAFVIESAAIYNSREEAKAVAEKMRQSEKARFFDYKFRVTKLP